MPFRNRRRVRNLAVALLLLGLAAWVVPSYFSAERYRRRLRAGLERTLHRPVRFGVVTYRVLPRPGFTIDNVEVGEDPDFGSEPFARVDQIDCALRWHSLWNSYLDFAYLGLERPSFNIVLNSRGEWNVERFLLQSGLTGSPGPVQGQNASIAAEKLDLNVDDARVNFQVGSNKKAFALTDVRAGLEVDWAERRVRFNVIASPVRADLTIPTPGPVEAHGTWTPGQNLRGPMDVWLRTRGSLLFDWVPVLTGKNTQLYGVVDSDIHLTGSLPDLGLEGETHLTQVHLWGDLPPSDPMPWAIRFRGHVVRERQRVLVDALDAAFADSHLHVSGSVDHLVSAPQLDLVMSLERSRLEDVLAVVRRILPNTGSWKLKGRIDAMLAVQGPWEKRRYGGFVGARELSLVMPSKSFPLSDIAVRINSHGASIAPAEIMLAPRVALSAQGAVERTDRGPRYQVQLSAKNVPLHEVVSFGRGLGINAFQQIDATGSATASIFLTGPVWPPGRPALTAHAEVRAGRLFIPGLTEPLNVPRANVQIVGDQITANPVVAVMGTSVLNARLAHRGPRINPWEFDLHANSLNLEQSAFWFDAIGPRRPLHLLDRLPGLASSTALREAASKVFGSLNAEGRLDTPLLSYRGVTLKDFDGSFEVEGRAIRMKAAKFRVGSGHGRAEGLADFRTIPATLSAKTSIDGLSLQSWTSRLAGPARELSGSVDVTGRYATKGLAREEMAENLTGHMDLHVRDISLGNFDPLRALVEAAGWGKIEPARPPVTLPPAILSLDLSDRTFRLNAAKIDINGAVLQCSGTYGWNGVVNLSVAADMWRMRRRWIVREDVQQPSSLPLEVRLAGSIDHLASSDQEAATKLGTGRNEGRQ